MKCLVTLVTFAVASIFSINSFAVSCSGALVYSSGTNYTQGQRVQDKGSLFTCNIAGWCSSTAAWAYEPGVGSAWQQAWSLVGVCDGAASSVANSVVSSKANSSASSINNVSYGVEAGTTSATFFVNITSGFADLHYIKNGAGQQNFSMLLVNGRRAYTLNNLVKGDVVKYWFTYQNPVNGLALDTASQIYTHGGAVVSSSSLAAQSSVAASTAVSSSSSSANTLPGWTLVWSDEFNGDGQPDPAKWNYHVGNGFNPGINTFDGWGNQEFEWYRPENCVQQGGNLVLRGENKPITTDGKTFDWRSCRITTQGKVSWTYGRIEARISSPSIQGKWDAFWMLGDSSNASYTTDYNAPASRYDTMASNWPSIGEVDIFENVNQDNFTFHHNFWDVRSGVFPYTPAMNADYGGQGQIGNTEAFHVYALEWDQFQQRYYVDGVQTHVIDISPGSMEEFHKPMHIIMNLAMGGRLVFGYNPIPAQWPKSMLVDYVRVYQKGSGNSSTGTNSSASSSSGSGNADWSKFNPGNPTAGGTHPRLTIRNGCMTKPMTVHWLTAPGFKGGAFNAPNHNTIGSGAAMTYNIPDKGLAAMRFWPGFGCDGAGQNCQVGQSGGPAEFGFNCPPQGCAPPIDSKFEATFGCVTGIGDGACQQNPSAPGQPLGRNDWWNSSAVDGFTVPIKVVVNGFCPTGKVDVAPFWGPGGPAGGQINCSGLSVAKCPANDNLSADGKFPALANMDLMVRNPSGGNAGCYSPSGKLTFANWGNKPTFVPEAPEAQWYACPTPPISPAACSAGPASRSKYHDYVHSVCSTYAYAYDDGAGLASCPASTLTTYDVTFYCP